MTQLQQYYEGKIKAVSFDKGFYSHDNLVEREKIISLVCLPKNVQVLGSLLLKKAKRCQIHQAKAAA
jgi:hypothetical protein